jgi:hypothetical protein
MNKNSIIILLTLSSYSLKKLKLKNFLINSKIIYKITVISTTSVDF